MLGNEAADPDSCVSAIAMAAALDATLAGSDDIVVAPLVLVPRADFKLQLDRVHLLRRAELVGTGDGPAWTPSHVTFGDELDLPSLLASSQPSHPPCRPQIRLPTRAKCADCRPPRKEGTSTVPPTAIMSSSASDRAPSCRRAIERCSLLCSMTNLHVCSALCC